MKNTTTLPFGAYTTSADDARLETRINKMHIITDILHYL